MPISAPIRVARDLWTSAPYDRYSFSHQLKSVYPVIPRKEEFSETISGLSPGFVEIYNEAKTAGAFDLMQIVGIGYRKALEFLVKDYATFRNPAQEADIKRSLLAQCIRQYIADGRIQAIAERAVWLGNDEAHYERRWENKDVEHLKALVGMTLGWIELEIESEQIITEMQPKAKEKRP